MIALNCPTCSTPMKVPDSAIGTRGKCRKCGGIVHVPGNSTKVCIECGTNVSASPRFKDERGKYRCKDCNEKLLVAAQARQIEIDRAADGFNRAKSARKIGNIIVLSVWTPLVLLKLGIGLANSTSSGFLAGPLIGSLISYIFPFLIISLVWPAYRKDPKKLGADLQRLIDGKDANAPVPPSPTTNNICGFLFIMFVIASTLQLLRFAGVDLEYHGSWWQNLPAFGNVFSGIGVFVALFFIPTQWSSLMAARQPLKALGLVGGFGLIAWAITLFLYAQR